MDMEKIRRWTLLTIMFSIVFAACTNPGGVNNPGSGGGDGGSGGGGGGGGNTGNPPSFALALTPKDVSVFAGDSVNVKVILNPQNGFRGAVALSLLDSEGRSSSGFRLNASSAELDGTNVRETDVAISVDSRVSAGRYRLVLSAEGGEVRRTADLEVAVKPKRVVLKVSDPWAKGYEGYFRTSDQSDWQRLTFNNGEAFFDVPDSNYGVALRCNDTNYLRVSLVTFKEASNHHLKCDYGYGNPPQGKQVTINVDASAIQSLAGVSSGDEVFINGFYSYPGAPQLDDNLRTTVSYLATNPSQQDIIVEIRRPGSYLQPLRAIKIVRSVDFSSSDVLDVAFNARDIIAAQTVTVSNPLPSDYQSRVGVGFIARSNTVSGELSSGESMFLPIADFQEGDRYLAFAEAVKGSYFSGRDGERIFSFKGFSNTQLSVSFPSPWASGAVTLNSNSLPLFSGISYPNAVLYGLSTQNISVLLSKNFLGDNNTFDLNSLTNLVSQTGVMLPASGTANRAEISAVVSPNRFQQVLDFVYSFGTMDILPLLTSDFELHLINAAKEYFVGGSPVNIP